MTNVGFESHFHPRFQIGDVHGNDAEAANRFVRDENRDPFPVNDKGTESVFSLDGGPMGLPAIGL